MRGYADHNASLRIGQRLIARAQEPQKEKPHALARRAQRESKDSGVGVSKACQTPKWAIYPPGRRGDHTNGHGTGAPHQRQNMSATKVVKVVGKPSAHLTYPCRKA